MKKLLYIIIIMLIVFPVSSSAYAENNLIYKYNNSENTPSVEIKNNSTKYIWKSPASSIIKYGSSKERSIKNINSENEKCRISISEIPEGIRVIYDYYTIGIRYPIEYTYQDNYLKAYLKVSEIEETGDKIALSISVLPQLGSADKNQNGYFVIPDGCGTLINFSPEKYSYSKRVYGDNITAVPEKKQADEKQIYLPCYGVVKSGNAFLAVAEKGDSNVFINADTGDINSCYFSFVIRETDNFSMSDEAETSITVFESGDIQCDDIEVRYYPVGGNNSDYCDIAKEYRRYIMEKYNLSRKEKISPALYINTYGGVEKEISVMGFPAERKKSLTNFSQAQEILENLKYNGISDINLSYRSWTDCRISEKIDTSAKPSKILGGYEDFKKLSDFADKNNIGFYPEVDNIRFSGGFSGNMSVRVSGAYSGIPEYNPAYGIKDDTKKFLSLLSPEKFKKIYNNFFENYNKLNINRISSGEISYTLYGNYSGKKLSRYNTMKLICEIFDSSDKKILADGANAYIFPYAECIINVPCESSHYDLFSEDVPFYQIVIHGLFSYSSEPVNSMPNPQEYIIKSTAYGSCLSFDFIYENTAVLQNTNLNHLFYADYSGWIDKAISGYKYNSEILNSVQDCFIENCYKKNNNIITVYSNGVITKINPEGDEFLK